MATKQAYRDDDYPSAIDTPAQHTVRLRIKGLKAVYGEDGVFELSGAQQRLIDHAALAEALGATQDPELTDKVLATVFKFDMVRLLTERVEV
jgi:CHAD domain-containing protein